jgi:hypothetical protein
MLERPLAGALDDWTIGNWIAEGNSQFDNLGAGANCRQRYFARGVQVWVTTRDVSHKAGMFLELNRQCFLSKHIHNGGAQCTEQQRKTQIWCALCLCGESRCSELQRFAQYPNILVAAS